MQELKLIAATYKDTDTISELAKLIWNQHYPEIISQQQIDYMLDLMYSKQSLSEQMQAKGHLFFLIQSGTSNLGFISVNPLGNHQWFLNKFYINQNNASKGLGGKSFRLLLDTITPNKMSLTVNRKNYKSINFYFKLGFKIEEVADFDIGNGYVMNDFVMVWNRS